MGINLISKNKDCAEIRMTYGSYYKLTAILIALDCNISKIRNSSDGVEVSKAHAKQFAKRLKHSVSNNRLCATDCKVDTIVGIRNERCYFIAGEIPDNMKLNDDELQWIEKCINFFEYCEGYTQW